MRYCCTKERKLVDAARCRREQECRDRNEFEDETRWEKLAEKMCRRSKYFLMLCECIDEEESIKLVTVLP